MSGIIRFQCSGVRCQHKVQRFKCLIAEDRSQRTDDRYRDLIQTLPSVRSLAAPNRKGRHSVRPYFLLNSFSCGSGFQPRKKRFKTLIAAESRSHLKFLVYCLIFLSPLLRILSSAI